MRLILLMFVFVILLIVFLHLGAALNAAVQPTPRYPVELC